MHFLWYYVNQGATVVYDCVENDTAWVFGNDGRCRVIRSPRNTIDVPELDDTDTVHIHDAKAGENSREPIRGICHVKLMTSANLSSHKQFERSVPAKYAYPETPPEIFELIGEEFNMDSDWVAGCADKYGCNVRLLVMGREGAQEVVNSALERWSSKIMMDIIHDNNLTPSHTGNTAVLITPHVHDSTSENEDPLALQRRYKFLTASWDFASAHVRLQVQDKHAKQLLDIARSVCQDKDKGAKAEWAIPVILAAGGEFTVRKFVDKDFTTDTITLDAAKLISGPAVSGSDTAKIDHVLSSCKDPNVWYCFSGTFPLFDLFRPPYMFVNSTVNATHKTHYGLAAHLVEKCPDAEMYYAAPRVVFDKINQMPTFGKFVSIMLKM